MPFNGPVEDKLEIHELVMVYGDAVTRKNSKDWGSTWAEDAIWSVPNFPGLEKVEGRTEIVKKWEEAMENYEYIVFTALLGSLNIKEILPQEQHIQSKLVQILMVKNRKSTGNI